MWSFLVRMSGLHRFFDLRQRVLCRQKYEIRSRRWGLDAEALQLNRSQRSAP